MKYITDSIKKFFSMKNGYTIIEVLVAVAIFTLVIAAPTGFLVSAIRAQQKALLSQKALDETSYVLEYMSRSIRMAEKELSGLCLSSNGLNYEKIEEEGKTGLKFINYHGQCQEFFLDANDNNRLKEVIDGGIPTPLTSMEISSFKIESHGDSWAQTKSDGTLDHNQPKVTIFLEIEGIIQLQTTISQRNLDIEYN